jgi:hypothetical protein
LADESTPDSLPISAKVEPLGLPHADTKPLISADPENDEWLAQLKASAPPPIKLHDDEPPPGGRQAIHWRSLSDAILFTLIIAGPTMLWEEMWRGKPMIDQPGDLWVVPAIIVTATYFVGGAIAGRHRRLPQGAIVQGVALAIPTAVVLIVEDLARRLVLNKGLPLTVVGLWALSLVAATAIAVLGSLYGRWLIRRRHRNRVRPT